MSCSSTPRTRRTEAQCCRNPIWVMVPASKARLKHPQMQPSFTASARQRPCQGREDLVQERDVAARFLGGGLGRPARAHARGEVLELFLERLLQRRGHVLLVGMSVLHALDEDVRRHVAEEG